jgi:hypothetical protein
VRSTVPLVQIQVAGEVVLELKLEYAITARCHPKDVWEKFCKIEEWKEHTEIFGEASWVHGKPWDSHSRFFVEVVKPSRKEFEVVVLRSSNLNEVMLLSHEGSLAGEQWISVTSDGSGETIIRTSIAVVGATEEQAPKLRSRLETVMKFWFGGLRTEAERHCEFVAL